MFSRLSKFIGARIKNPFFVFVLFIVVILFLYVVSFKLSGKVIRSAQEANQQAENSAENTTQNELAVKKYEESKKTILQRMMDSKSLYLSDDKVKNIKIEGQTRDNFIREIETFVKVRDVDDSFKPKNYGRDSSDIEFRTDFNFFEIKEKGKVEYYKIPVGVKDDFESMYKRYIYTSIAFITNKDDVGKIYVHYKNEKKRLWWPPTKKDLMYKILYKREVGKIQPEKEFEKTKKNYTIKMEKSNIQVTIQTMGKDFIKVTTGDNVAYYEVYTDLYNFLAGLFD